MRLKQTNCCALIIDYQEKLIPVIDKKDELVKNSVRLLNGLSLLGIPMMVTEQYPRGLGHTIPEIAEAAKGAPVFPKTAFGALGSDDLQGYIEQLAQMGRRQVLICGAEAHICVLQTALQLVEKGMQPVLMTDCIGSRRQADMLAAMLRAEHEGVQFCSTEMALFEMVSGKEHPQFKAISALVK